MNREIEFRLWDKIKNKMIYKEDVVNSSILLAIGLHGLPIGIDNDSFKENEIIGWNRDHNLILMQYTGLTDKNGKKIFEEDIILAENRKGIIILKDYSWTFKYKKHENDQEYSYKNLNWFESEDLEVIGNIYDKEVKE